jgi:hypothetical protein
VYKLRHCDFTEHDVFPDRLPQQQRLWPKVGCERLITNSGEFDFTVEDIQDMRREFQQFIENLSKVYGQWQKGAKRNGKIENKDEIRVVTIKEENVDDVTDTDKVTLPPQEARRCKVVTEDNPFNDDKSIGPQQSILIGREVFVDEASNGDEGKIENQNESRVLTIKEVNVDEVTNNNKVILPPREARQSKAEY